MTLGEKIGIGIALAAFGVAGVIVVAGGAPIGAAVCVLIGGSAFSGVLKSRRAQR